MKLHALFDEDHVLLHPSADSLDTVLRELLQTMPETFDRIAVQEVSQRLLHREREFPTVIYDCACLLHLRLDSIRTMKCALAIPEVPIEHPAQPEIKLKMVFLILAPQDQNSLMLQTLAAVTKLLGQKSFMGAIRGVKAASRVVRLIEESGCDVKKHVTASDVMEPIQHSVTLDMPLSEAMTILALAADEGLPVLDARGKLLGELTSKEILLLGMPKYMDLITNPEMLNSFEPFENYFRNEKKTLVRDVCRRDFIHVTPSTPIVGVAHKMITENRRRVYVMDETKALGVVYRKSIVTRVMNG